MNIKKTLSGTMLVVCMFTVTLAPALAMATTPAAVTAEAKATLLIKLLDQLRILQAELAALRSQEKNIDPQPAPVTAADYTRGPAAAKIQIVTFSDFECPFCKTFHGTLNAILAKYPTVSATYRQYPLEQLHPNAMQLSVAAECVGILGGDVAFWKFVDSSFASREVNAKTQMSRLPEFATGAGVASSAYTSCIAGAEAKNAVNADIADGTKASISGTPNSFIFKNGVKVDTILGSQPLSVVEAKIAKLLN